MAKTFEEAWAEKEREGYQYGEDALEQVRFGWEIAHAALAEDRQLAADVRTLNEWAKAARDRTCRLHGLQVALRMLVQDEREWVEAYQYFEGATPEAAIHAAAEAVRKGGV